MYVSRFALAGGLAGWTLGCSGSTSTSVALTTDGGTIDSGTTTDAANFIDGQRYPGGAATSAACTMDSDCLGGTCLGISGGVFAGNVRFDGGYCTYLHCTPDSQTGCGPDEWCIDSGDSTIGGYCVAMCSKADGLQCTRADLVCLGLGSWGGCFSKDAAECDAQAKTGCTEEEVCVRIGFEDPSLGRCEPLCDPFTLDSCAAGACYFVRTYSAAFCTNPPGTEQPDDPCTCDRCCVDGYACTPDPDGEGEHCKPICDVNNPDATCAGGTCYPLTAGEPYGGCVLPGSSGT